jgi:hypothetical protein
MAVGCDRQAKAAGMCAQHAAEAIQSATPSATPSGPVVIFADPIDLDDLEPASNAPRGRSSHEAGLDPEVAWVVAAVIAAALAGQISPDVARVIRAALDRG